jgi:hypothetical protein
VAASHTRPPAAQSAATVHTRQVEPAGVAQPSDWPPTQASAPSVGHDCPTAPPGGGHWQEAAPPEAAHTCGGGQAVAAEAYQHPSAFDVSWAQLATRPCASQVEATLAEQGVGAQAHAAAPAAPWQVWCAGQAWGAWTSAHAPPVDTQATRLPFASQLAPTRQTPTPGT